jgi:hypothetical protein
LYEKAEYGRTLSAIELGRVKSLMKQLAKPTAEMTEAIVTFLREKNIEFCNLGGKNILWT